MSSVATRGRLFLTDGTHLLNMFWQALDKMGKSKSGMSKKEKKESVWAEKIV